MTLIAAAAMLIATLGAAALPWQRAEPPPAPRAEAPPAAAIDPDLARILVTLVAARYERSYPREVVADLQARSGLRWAMPETVRNLPFTLHDETTTVRVVLDKLADACHLRIELHGHRVLVWQPADDARIAALEKELESLGQLGDRRSIPTLRAMVEGTVRCAGPRGDYTVGDAATLLVSLEDPEAATLIAAALRWLEYGAHVAEMQWIFRDDSPFCHQVARAIVHDRSVPLTYRQTILMNQAGKDDAEGRALVEAEGKQATASPPPAPVAPPTPGGARDF